VKRIALILLLAILSSANAQRKGCTDYFALNFNPKATENDNSCRYIKEIYSPTFLSELPEEINETSGLVFCGGLLWTHNDSGGDPVLYAIDTVEFKIVRRLTLKNAYNVDWEDITIDDDMVYVGDFGNNRGSRRDLSIYYFPLSNLLNPSVTEVVVDTIRFSFSDQTDFTPRKNAQGFDCEAFFASDENLYLLSKRWNDAKTFFYRLPKTSGTYVAEKIGGFYCDGLITGADYDRKLHRLALIGYKNKIWEPFMYLIYTFDESEPYEWHGRRIAMPNYTSTQTEGIVFKDRNHVYISAEKSPTFTSRIMLADISKWVETEYCSCYEKAKDKKIIKKSVDGKLSLRRLKIRRGLYKYELVDTSGQVVGSELKYVGKRADKGLRFHQLDAGTYDFYMFGRRRSYHDIITID